MQSDASILVSELKELILLLKNFGPDVSLRVRLQGQMWSDTFMSVSELVGGTRPGDVMGVVLTDPETRKTFSIPNIARIIQFELDTPVRNYRPLVHYTVLLFESENVSSGR